MPFPVSYTHLQEIGALVGELHHEGEVVRGGHLKKASPHAALLNMVAGFSNGLVLTCGASCGGLDILGLYLSKKGRGFTVGKFSLLFNACLLYTSRCV